MKKIFLIFPIFVFSFASYANEASRKCYPVAEAAVKKQAKKGYYDKNGIEAYNCEYAENGMVVLCDVSASKGQGAATDTYSVVLDVSCDYAMRVDLVGEE